MATQAAGGFGCDEDADAVRQPRMRLQQIAFTPPGGGGGGGAGSASTTGSGGRLPSFALFDGYNLLGRCDAGDAPYVACALDFV